MQGTITQGWSGGRHKSGAHASSYASGRQEAGEEVARRPLPRSTARIAAGLGLLGIGLGLAELIAPRRMNRLVGVRNGRAASLITRALGLRELATGLGLLGRRRPAPWLWARVAGDVVDLAVLARASRAARVGVGRMGAALAAVLGVTLVDLFAASKARGTERATLTGPVRKAITVDVSPERAYRFWRDFRNLPTFMERLESLELLDTNGLRSRWRMRVPMGRSFQWDAEIVEDRSNELIGWSSLDGSEIANRGEVWFQPAPGGRGTEISVELTYVPPAGELGRVASFLAHEALAVQLERDLRRAKQVLELGEVVHSDASVHRGRHPARPSERRAPAETQP